MDIVPNIDINRKKRKMLNPFMVFVYTGLMLLVFFLVDYVFVKKTMFKFAKPADQMQIKYKEKKYTQVIDIANQLLVAHNHSLHIYRYLWKSYLYTKQYNNTLKTLAMMEKITPDSVEIPLGLCTTFRFMEEYEKATYYCERVIDINPNAEQAHEQIIQILIEQNKYDEAVAYLDKLSDKQPDNLKRLLLRASISSIKLNYSNSIKLLEKAKKDYSDIPIIYYYLGKNYASINEYVKAASNLEEFTESVYNNDVDIKLLENAYIELAYAYEKARMFSNAYRAYKNAACFTMKLKKTDESISLMQRAIAATYSGYSGFVSQGDFKLKFKKLKNELERKCESTLFNNEDDDL